MKTKIKLFWKRYNHILWCLYFLGYMPWFAWLNVASPLRTDAIQIECSLDRLIPFCEWFAIPYFLWFFYIAVGFIFLLFNNRADFVRMCIFLFTGMTVCLIIYTVIPNYQALRPDFTALGRQNLLTRSIALLQQTDTPYNVLPSIHCLNSIGMNIALWKNKAVRSQKWIAVCVTILTVMICLSTVFVKQHSILDVLAAVLLSVPLYCLAYIPSWKHLTGKKSPHIRA